MALDSIFFPRNTFYMDRMLTRLKPLLLFFSTRECLQTALPVCQQPLPLDTLLNPYKKIWDFFIERGGLHDKEGAHFFLSLK